MEFTQKRLIELLNISKMAPSKALKNTPYNLKKVKGSTKKVKHYKFNDLPERYKIRLTELGEVQNNPTNIIKAKNKNFTQKYLCAKPAKQRKAILQVKLIEFYLKRDNSLNQQKWLNKILDNCLEFEVLGSVSIRQLNEWLRKYKEAKAKGENVIEMFVDGRGAKKNTTILTKEQQEMAIRYFLKQSHPNISTIHFIMCEYFGSSMPSYDTLNKFFNRWKKANPQLHLFSRSPDKWKNSYLISIGRESEKAMYRNHWWELDATPADVICSDGKRYTILGLIDIATRRTIFRVEDSNSKYAVTRLLREGILRFGIPENVVIDNGKEFVSNHFESVCANLDINIHVTPPFSGDKKPFIERAFGTLARGLFRSLQGFIGHDTAMREEIQARKSFGHKIMAQKKAKDISKEEIDAYAALWTIRKENIGIKLDFALTKQELQNSIDTWTIKYYEQKKHGGLNGKSPIKVWNSYNKPVQSISDESMLDLLLGESVKRKVGKKGISLEGCTYMHDLLVPYIGKHVQVMTRDDMGEVIVYDIDTMVLICKAVDYEYLGESREAAARLRKQQNKIKQQFNKAVRLAEESNDPTLVEMLKAKAEGVMAETLATTKRTAVTNMLIEDSANLEMQDKKELKASTTYDFRSKDEDGIPKKILKGGRPMFETFVDRFIWVLEHPEMINEKDKKLKEKRPESWEMAEKIIEERKLA